MEQQNNHKADYKTVAEDLRWSTDIMKVCYVLYQLCKQQTATVPFEI
jgi:hypothetical protein